MPFLVKSAPVHLQKVKQIWQLMFLGPTVPLMSDGQSLYRSHAELSVFIISWIFIDSLAAKLIIHVVHKKSVAHCRKT